MYEWELTEYVEHLLVFLEHSYSEAEIFMPCLLYIFACISSFTCCCTCIGFEYCVAHFCCYCWQGDNLYDIIVCIWKSSLYTSYSVFGKDLKVEMFSVYSTSNLIKGGVGGGRAYVREALILSFG